jgi:hypothetical protein
LAVRGFVLAKTGWTLEYINKLPETHLLFAYHWLSKVEEDTWDRLTSNLGTIWDRETLLTLQSKVSGSHVGGDKVFVPLSLVMNPELPDALLGKKNAAAAGPTVPEGTPTQAGDGLHTGMALPEGDEVVNMGELPKNEFFGLISQAGLANTK